MSGLGSIDISRLNISPTFRQISLFFDASASRNTLKSESIYRFYLIIPYITRINSSVNFQRNRVIVNQPIAGFEVAEDQVQIIGGWILEDRLEVRMQLADELPGLAEGAVVHEADRDLRQAFPDVGPRYHTA